MLAWFVSALAASPPTAARIASLARVDEAALSPDGRTLVYAQTTPQPPAAGADEWTVTTQLWMVRGVGGTATPPRQITAGEASAQRPQFSPDGAWLAFLRDQGERARLWVLPLDGGEALPVDTGELEPAAFAWAPDSVSLAFTAPDPDNDVLRAERARDGDVERVGTFEPDRLYLVARTGGNPTRAAATDRHVAALAFAPDGKHVAVATSATSDPYESLLEQVAVVDLADRELRPIGEVGPVQDLRWSPDGAHLAWLTTHGTLTLQNRVVVADPRTGAVTDAAGGLDATFEALAWAGNDALVALAADRTRTAAWRLRADGGGSERLGGVADRTVSTGLAGDAAGARFATLAQSGNVPREPAWFDLSGGSGVVAHPNDLGDWALGRVEVFAWKGPGRQPLEGVLTLPPAGSGPAPLMVFPHGGPDAVSQETFDPWAKYFAGRGYAVFRPNYRGSTGYGRAFYTANRGKLGRIEFADIESGVDALVAAGKVDPQRLVYGGWSWGGYLTAWTIGHTARYRAAVAGAAVVDVVSQYALSDVNHGIAAQWEFEGDPWRDPAKFAAANPMLSLSRAVTPTLVLHGTADARVGYTSAVILHRALTDVGCEVELWAYPDEDHGFTDPRHVVHVLEQWADWYDRHLAPAEAAVRPASPR